MGCVKLLIQALVSKQSPELALDAAWALNEMVRRNRGDWILTCQRDDKKHETRIPMIQKVSNSRKVIKRLRQS